MNDKLKFIVVVFLLQITGECFGTALWPGKAEKVEYSATSGEISPAWTTNNPTFQSPDYSGDNISGASSSTGSTRTVELTEPGTLGDYISDADKYSITSLTISGPLNGTDLRLLRDMAGNETAYRKTTSNGSKLQVLDLTDAFIVSGGSWYLNAYDKYYYTTESTIFPEWLFAWCPALTHVYLPKNCTSIGSSAFMWCENLQSVTIPVGVENILGNNFNYALIETLTLPSTIKKVNSDFYETENLTNVYCYAAEPPTMGSGFNATTNIKSGTLYVPEGTSDLYWRAKGWTDFNKIIEQGEIKIPIRIEIKTIGGTVSYNDFSLRKKFPQYTNEGHAAFEVDKGSTFGIYAIPDYGYEVDSIVRDGVVLDLAYTPLAEYISIDNITSSTTITVKFKEASSETPEKCEAPTIKYSDGELVFESSTAGAEYHHTLTCKDVVADSTSTGNIKLSAAYDISVYATADGYTNSDVTEGTLYWIEGAMDDASGIKTVNAKAIVASSHNGIVTISGLNDGERVAFYTVDGISLGTAPATNGSASMAVSGNVVVAKIGTESIKISVK